MRYFFAALSILLVSLTEARDHQTISKPLIDQMKVGDTLEIITTSWQFHLVVENKIKVVRLESGYKAHFNERESDLSSRDLKAIRRFERKITQDCRHQYLVVNCVLKLGGQTHKYNNICGGWKESDRLIKRLGFHKI